MGLHLAVHFVHVEIECLIDQLFEGFARHRTGLCVNDHLRAKDHQHGNRSDTERVNSCCASVSTLANTMSGCLSDAASKMGPKTWQGPHHEALKSMSTMSLDERTSSRFSLVSCTVAIIHSFR